MRELEKEVIHRWQNGDRQAFETLVRRYMYDAYVIAMGFTRNAEDARDLSQDAFIKAFEARAQFKPEKPFYPWFYRILKNHCLNFVQRGARRSEPLFHDDESQQERFAANGPSPHEKLERKERKQMLWRAIEKLSFEHREVITLKNFKGYTYEEIAEVLDIPIGTVMSRLYYARKMLKSILTELDTSDADSRVYAEGSETVGDVV